MVLADESDHDYLDNKGYCKYCHSFCQIIKKDEPIKPKILIDDTGKKFIVDANGNKYYLQTNANG